MQYFIALYESIFLQLIRPLKKYIRDVWFMTYTNPTVPNSWLKFFFLKKNAMKKENLLNFDNTPVINQMGAKFDKVNPNSSSKRTTVVRSLSQEAYTEMLQKKQSPCI